MLERQATTELGKELLACGRSVSGFHRHAVLHIPVIVVREVVRSDELRGLIEQIFDKPRVIRRVDGVFDVRLCPSAFRGFYIIGKPRDWGQSPRHFEG